MSGERKVRGCTPLQMRFVDEYMALDGRNDINDAWRGSEAAHKAGYAAGDELTLYKTGGRLRRNEAVQAEIYLRRKAAAKTNGLTTDTLIAELITNAELARDAGKFAASTRAYLGAGKVAGLIVDRVEVRSIQIRAKLDAVVDALTHEELVTLARSALDSDAVVVDNSGNGEMPALDKGT